MTQNKSIKLPKLIGHRGVKGLCPENTIESVNRAFDIGLKYVEIDVKISRDEVPILLHDDTLDRTTDGNGYPTNFYYEDLKKLDAGEFFYKKKTNNTIPNLVEIINLCKERQRNLNIELKPNVGYEKKNVLKVFELTKNIEDFEIFFSSFDIFSFIKISEYYSNSNRSLLIDTFKDISIDDLLSISQKYHSNICGLNIDIITSEIIRKIKDKNLLITVFSEKNISFEKAKGCFNIGVDSIFTDDPSELKDFF